jgi:diaminohydroxyphosphoribosylaminopyrimidine deaminase/5-amino-6-(5-phosphoribosylamino)uracil reductase
LNIQSIIIEGGNKLAESFINEHAWDEARVIENTTMIIDNGLRAPALSNQVYVASRDVATDNISFYKNSFGSSLSL